MKVYFTRHAHSMEYAGVVSIDSPLSDLGRDQAKQLEGEYDIVISSPMRRCLETLHYSKIKYGKLIIEPLFRERIFGEACRMLFEHQDGESDESFFGRIKKFEESLNGLKDVSKVLLIGHGYYVGCWKFESFSNGVENAKIVEL